MKRFALLLFVSALVSGCGHAESSEFQFRIYDPLGRIEAEVTNVDVLRKSARAGRMSDGSWSFYFRLTDEGEAEFHRLTRALAKRGARLHRPQRFRIEMNGMVLSRSTIDYRIFPDGFGAETGIELDGLRPPTARRLADQMRND